jgi:hypothetical protein
MPGTLDGGALAEAPWNVQWAAVSMAGDCFEC